MKIGTMVSSMQSVSISEAMVDGMGQLGLDSLWFPDHLLGFVHPEIWPEFPASRAVPDPDAFLDPFCVAAAVGGRTNLPFGTCVTDATRRRGADLTRTAMTLHDACRGGFTLGIGAGELESTLPFGYDFKRPVGNLESALSEIRSLLDHGRMPNGLGGRTGLPRNATKGVPEIWVAAQGGERSLGLVGRYGDGWLSVTHDPDRYAELLAKVRSAAAQAGRNAPTAGLFPVTIFGTSRDAVATLLDENPILKLVMLFAEGELWAEYGLEHPNGRESKGHRIIPHELDPKVLREVAPRIPVEMVERWALIGNAEEIAVRILPFQEAGLEYLVVADFSGLIYAPEELPVGLAEMAKLAARVHEL